MRNRSAISRSTLATLWLAVSLAIPPACSTPSGRPEATSLPPGPLSAEALRNAEYRGIYEGELVQLTDGRYEGEPFVEGGASRPTVTFIEPLAFGDLNGDGVNDAAVLLVENSGGSGSFVFLAAVVNASGQPKNVATQLLGDRANVQALRIDGGKVTVEMLTHGPADPMCCPSLEVVDSYTLQGDAWEQLSHEEAAPPLAADDVLNAEYNSEWPAEGVARLVDGRYEEEIAPGAASKLTIMVYPDMHAFGDLNGDGLGDAAVVLATSGGGSGTFISLEALINAGGVAQHVATVELGDRTVVKALSVEEGVIRLEMVAHGPNDPMCCPSLGVVETYELQGNNLDVLSREEQVPPLTADAVLNAVFASEWAKEGVVQLVEGKYEEEIVPGSASKLSIMVYPDMYAFGDLDGDGFGDAVVVLGTSGGGSGTFISLEALVNEGGAARHVASADLGDRTQLRSVSLDGGVIELDMVVHGPDDPMCCPSLGVLETYELLQGELVLLSHDEQGPLDTAPSVPGAAATVDLLGPIWIWQGLKGPSVQEDMVVTYPPNYRLEFLPDGSLAVKADCNLASGGYTAEGNKLTLQFGPTTLAECRSGSYYDRYVAFLAEVVSYVQQGNALHLNLASAGYMVLGKLYAVTGRIVGPEGAAFPESARVEAYVLDATGTQVGGVLLATATQFPVTFEANYHAPSIQPDQEYFLEVTIQDGEGNVVFATPVPFPVLTQGNPTYHVSVPVVAMSG